MARMIWIAAALAAVGCLDKKKDAGGSSPASGVSGAGLAPVAVGPGGSSAAENPVGTWRGSGTYLDLKSGMRSTIPVKLLVTRAADGGFLASFEPYVATLRADKARAGIAVGEARYTVMPDVVGVATVTFMSLDKAHMLLEYPASKEFPAFSLEAELAREVK